MKHADLPRKELVETDFEVRLEVKDAVEAMIKNLRP